MRSSDTRIQNEPFLTADGSHSLRSGRFGVSYHSNHGAVGESRHVFLEGGLRDALRNGPEELTILEMGFGTGLNALLVRQLADAHPRTRFRYLTFERYPITLERARQLNYPTLLGEDTARFLQLHTQDWGEEHRLAANFHFTKYCCNFLAPDSRALYPPASVDVIFYDAFAPANQPEFWAPPALAICRAALRPGGHLVTYCAQGQFKRDLRALGFTVEALPGPPGKREMTRAFIPAVAAN